MEANETPRNEMLPNEMLPKETLRCENCHAMIPKDSAKCPYCGALNLAGGEKQYMEQLFDLKEDVEGLQAVPAQEYRKGLGSAGKVIRRTLLILVAVAAVVGAAFLAREKYDSSYELSEEDVKAQLSWEKENYPVLNELYAAGDYEGILVFQGNHYADEGYSVYNWEHVDFINVYSFYRSCMDSAEKIVSGEYDDDDVYWLVMDAMFVLEERSYAVYSAEEEELIDGYRQEAKGLIDSLLGAGEEFDKLCQECYTQDEYGTYFDYDLAQKKVKAFAKQYRKK